MLVDVFNRYIVVGCIVVLLTYNFLSLRFVLLLFLIVLVVVYFSVYKNRRTRERRRLLFLGLSLRPNSQHEISKTARPSTIATRDHSRISFNSIENEQTLVRRRTKSTNVHSSNEDFVLFSNTLQDSVAHGFRLSQQSVKDSWIKSGILPSEIKRSPASQKHHENVSYKHSSNANKSVLDLQITQRIANVETPVCTQRISRHEGMLTRRILTSFRRHPIHHPHYPVIGSYPTVRLNRPVTSDFNASRSSSVISPVTVKLAPVESLQLNPRWSFIYSPPSPRNETSLNPCDTKTVVAALRERRESRKRSRKYDVVEDTSAKRLRRDTMTSSKSTSPLRFSSSVPGRSSTSLYSPLEGMLLSPDNGKRPSTPSDLSRGLLFKKQRNNAVFSSYSSSQRRSQPSPMEQDIKSTKRRNEDGHFASLPLSKTSRQQNGSYEATQQENLSDHQTVQNQQNDSTSHNDDEARRKSDAVKIASPKESVKSPFLKEGANLSRRTFSLYASLENTSKKNYNLPNHLATLEEFRQDKKLEEERLKHLLSGIVDVGDGVSETVSTQSSSVTSVFVEEEKSAYTLSVSKPLSPLTTSLSLLVTQPSIEDKPPSLLTCSAIPTSTNGKLLTTSISTPVVSNLFGSTVSTIFPNQPAAINFSSVFPSSKSSVSEAESTKNLFVSATQSSGNANTPTAFTFGSNSSGIVETLVTTTTTTNVGFSLSNPSSTISSPHFSTTTAMLPPNVQITTFSASPSFNNSPTSMFPKASTTQTTFSCTSPISSEAVKPSTGPAVLTSTPAVSSCALGTATVTSTTTSGGFFFNLSNPQTKLGVKPFSSSTPIITGLGVSLPSESPLMQSPGTRLNQLPYSFTPTTQGTILAPQLSFANPLPPSSIISSNPSVGLSFTNSSSNAVPSRLGTQTTPGSSMFGPVATAVVTNTPQSSHVFGTTASVTPSCTSSIFKPSTATPSLFGTFGSSLTPGQTSTVFGTNTIAGPTLLSPSSKSVTLPTTPHFTPAFGSNLASKQPDFGSLTPNLFGGSGAVKTLVPSFGTSSTTTASNTNIFGSAGQSQASSFTPSNFEFTSPPSRLTFSSNSLNSSTSATPFQSANTTGNQLGFNFNPVSRPPSYSFNFTSPTSNPTPSFGTPSNNDNSSVTNVQGRPFVFSASPQVNLFSVGTSSVPSRNSRKSGSNRRKL